MARSLSVVRTMVRREVNWTVGVPRIGRQSIAYPADATMSHGLSGVLIALNGITALSLLRF